MSEYLYNGQPISEQRIRNAASNLNLSFDDYIKKYNLTTKEEEEENVSWFDQTWFGRGYSAASTTGEATDLMTQDFSNVDIETIQEFIEAKEDEAKNYAPSERMQKFQKKYKEEGETWSAFFRGVREQPGLLPELFVQSLGTQIGTLADAPSTTLAAAGTGAAAGVDVVSVIVSGSLS